MPDVGRCFSAWRSVLACSQISGYNGSALGAMKFDCLILQVIQEFAWFLDIQEEI